jgi:iron complex outermembrane recepter protein
MNPTHTRPHRRAPRQHALAVATMVAVVQMGIVALGALGVQPTHAQTGSDGQAIQSTTITVTAQRREQELQKVPLPISTFRAIDLENRAIVDTLKVASYVPNMFASNNTGLGTANVYFIRGLGNTESIATFDPPVGTYIDDIYVSRQNANNFGFFDVERIEVLRGPQGTLFGRNTTGGAMRVILKRPSFKPGGYFFIGAGSYKEVSARGSVDVPVSEQLATKISFFAKKDKGYTTNLTTSEQINDAESYGLRAALRLRLSDDLSWDAAIEGMQDGGASVLNAVSDSGLRVAKTGLRKSQRFANAAGAALVTGDKNGFGLGNDVRSTALTSNVRWSMNDAVSLEFITGWRDMTQKFAIDFGNTPVASGGFTIANDGQHKQFSQEVKAVGDLGALSWVGGVFFMKEDNHTDFADIFNTAFSGAPLPGTTLVLADRVLDNEVTSLAVYAQGDYKIASDLTATLGLRYTDEKKTVAFSDNRASAAAAARVDTANLVAAGIPTQLNTKVLTPRLALSWQLEPQTMLFASATRGFKSGGWNARGTSAVNLQPFEPEFIWSYEAGWRTSFMNNRLRLNGTAFKSDTKKLQTPSAFVGPTGAVSFITRNFADLSNQGLELDFNADITSSFNLYMALGVQDAKYTNIADSILAQQVACRASIAANATSRPQCLNGIIDRDGNIAPPVRAPKQTVNLGASYGLEVGAGMKVSGSAHGSYASRSSVGTAANSFADAHTVWNASLSLSGAKDSWRITADCSNCTNKTWNTAFLAGFNYLPDPRRYTLKASYRY